MKKIFYTGCFLLFLLLIVGKISAVYKGYRTGEEINWQVISAGGTKGSSANFILRNTVGQTATGHGVTESFGLSHGYWYATEPQGCCVLRGDVAGNEDPGQVGIPDGSVLVDDIVYLVDYLFKGGTAPTCLDEGDCAIPLDGEILVNDIVYLVDYIFKGGPAPPSC